MSVQNFKTIRVPILGLPLGSLAKKCHLEVALAKNYRVYYKERNGAFSQRLRAL